MKTLFRIIFLTLFVYCFGSFGCKKDSNKSTVVAIEDLLVKNNEITGWAYSSSSWVANNGSDLTQKIDGGAEQYIKYGFIEASNQGYTGTINGSGVEITIRVYNLGSDENTSLIMDDPEVVPSNSLIWVDNHAGFAAKYMRFGGLSQHMYFNRGKYLIYLEADTDSEESLNILKQFALNVDEKVKSSIE